jgi:hypothetical protein
VREDAAKRVARVVARTLGDERGRWLFDPSHDDARSEWALAGEDDGRIVHVVLDRSFVCGGYRYIVDFKTGAHLGGDASAFLRQEFERYAPQLERYARIVAAFDKRPGAHRALSPAGRRRVAGASVRRGRRERSGKIVSFSLRIPQCEMRGAQAVARLRPTRWHEACGYSAN